MTIEDAYRTMQAASGIKVGDRVKVLRRAKSFEMGWSEVWNSDMDATIGKEYTVTEVQPRTIGLSCGWFFPFFVLEKLSPLSRLTPKHGDLILSGGEYVRLVTKCAKGWRVHSKAGWLVLESTERMCRFYQNGMFQVIGNVFDEGVVTENMEKNNDY